MLTSPLKAVTSLGLTTRNRKLLVLCLLVGIVGMLILGMSFTSTSSSHKSKGRDLDQWVKAKIRQANVHTHPDSHVRKVLHPVRQNKNQQHGSTIKGPWHKSLNERRRRKNRKLKKVFVVFPTLTSAELLDTSVHTSKMSFPAQQLTEHKQGFPDSGDGMAAHENFDAERVYNLFGSCRKENDVLMLDCYVNAYEELCKLFRHFGTIFSFVTSDVEEKIGILRDYRKSDHAEQYKTIQSMLAYEVASDTIKKKKANSGSRTLLRLHRALEFIMEFLQKLKESDNRCKFANVVTKAYDDTLAKHHPWLIKKAVHVAMYMLPSRPDLLKKMGLKDDEKDMNVVMELVKELNLIYKITQELYAKDKLLDLP